MGIVKGHLIAWLAVPALFVLVHAGGPGWAAEYVVDGFALGQPISSGGGDYASYDCHPSEDYDAAINCTKVQDRKGQAGKLVVSSRLIHAEDGISWLETVHAAPVKLSRQALEKELEDLARVIGEPPALVDWEPGYAPDLTAVVAVWGGVELNEIYYPVPDDIDRPGGYFDLIGDPATSLQKFLPVYEVKGGPGYIYAANFDAEGIGHRYYVAVNPQDLAPAHYRRTLRALLAKDAALDPDDYSVWGDVAMATRTLALATSSPVANQQFDVVASEFPTSKLRSHVWALLPSGAIQRLRQGSYWIDYDSYGPNTGYPDIRQALQDLIANEPDDNFVEFAHLLLGDYQGGLAANPDTIINGVFHYALGIESFRHLMREALTSFRDHPPPDITEEDLRTLAYLTTHDPEDPDSGFSLDGALNYATRYPGIDPGGLATASPEFRERAEAIQGHFANITDDMSVADDAAFIRSWLDLEVGDLPGALQFASNGLAIGHAHADIDGPGRNGSWLDYQSAIRAQTLRIIGQLPRDEVVRTLQADPVLSKEGFLWYGTAREAYRAFDYGYAIELAEAGLSSLGLPSEQLPATTDPVKIRAAIEQMDPALVADLNIVELPYLLEASREFASYEADLAAAADATDTAAFSERSRKLISKYSMLVSRPDDVEELSDVPPRHQDLRQVLHLIDKTLEQTAGNPAYRPLREWLEFRRIRVLTVSDPDAVDDAVAKFAADFPASEYLDDALAERVFVKGMLERDMDAAWLALDELVRRAPPDSNAIDNGYSWLQISLRCAGLYEEADLINTEIVRLFPFSRHAEYALGRAVDPNRPARGCDGGYLD